MDRRLVLNEVEATTVCCIFERYLATVTGPSLVRELAPINIRSKVRWRGGEKGGDSLIGTGALYAILKNPIYAGKLSTAARDMKASMMRSSKSPRLIESKPNLNGVGSSDTSALTRASHRPWPVF